MIKTTAHSNCTHPKTKSARALCRKSRTEIKTLTTDYGTFEIKTIKAKDLKKTDMVVFRCKTGEFFTSVTYDAFQCERLNTKTMAIEKIDEYRIDMGGPSKYVPGDYEYEVAVDPAAVKAANWAYTRSLTAKF